MTYIHCMTSNSTPRHISHISKRNVYIHSKETYSTMLKALLFTTVRTWRHHFCCRMDKARYSYKVEYYTAKNEQLIASYTYR